jgi:L-ascorbate metabolism protein UlaG (beta-lactamase superfamily)
MLNEAGFPFNRINLALTTHIHGDHFNRDAAVDFLIANPEANHLSTIEVDESLQTSSSYNQIQSQSRCIFPDPNTRIQTQISGITVDVIRIDHHGGLEGDEHVAFLFNLNGIKILHVGDACKVPSQWDGLRLARENIDILIAPFGSSCSNWTLVFEEDNPFNIIKWYIQPKHIILSHLNFETTETEIQTTIDLLRDNLPGIGFSYFHPTILKQKIYTKEGNTIQVRDKPTS